MLILLLRTRLHYYRNYLRHHFDRMVWLEIGLIVFILLFLAVRSPADIGYSLKFLRAEDFSLRLAEHWAALLPIFYLVVEALALVTLRPTGEWQILGVLPIHKTAITKYHLLRHLGKTAGLLLLGALPFWVGNDSVFVKISRGLFALGILLLLQWAGFAQAYTLRNTNKKTLQKLLRWLPVEAAIILFLIGGAPWLQRMFVGVTSHALIAVLPTWSLALALLFYLHRNYEPGWIETQTSQANENIINRPRGIALSNKVGLTGVLILHDVQFLWRRKRSTFAWLSLAAIILAAAAFAQESAEAVYASSIVLEIIFSLLLTNALLVLFEREIKTVGLIRSLPISAHRLWRSRWLLAGGFMVLPMLSPILIIPFKFIAGADFLLFLVMAIGVPAVFAALYCNAGFGLFPNTKYCSLLLNISLGLMILFWFYMPFGTILLLGIAALWIGKSQRHFQLLEI
ncbi:hypothetical protein L0337_33305 [candidate division KSB1 bacterium]|nr:hypothetical protein [candidate division KSB1 bacterium]